MSDDEIDGNDDECFYEMTEFQPIISKSSEINESDKPVSEPTTPADENFYQIIEELPSEIPTIQAHIDEPFTPSDDLNPNFHYTAISPNEYIKLMMNYVDEIKDILQLSSSIIKLLLNHFKWNKQRLLEKFYEIDPGEFFQQAKIINPYIEKHQSENSSEQICLICYSDNPDDMFNLECKHIFCNNCWKNYIENQIVNEGLAQTIVCPDSQCEILVDEDTILKFLENNPFAQHIYEKIILNSYVDNNPRARWCPGKNCGYIINATSLTSAYNYAQLITCNHCQTTFCFQCAQPWHDPIKCVLLLQWNKKILNDPKTILWLKTNTKQCPKCKVNIEKNGGCNHMTCRHYTYEFCWLCFGLWSGHNQCNRYNEEENSNEISSLSRYTHYYDRFHNHEQSLNLEKKLFEKIHKNLIRNVDQLSKYDIQLIEKSFDILLHCRHMLIYTYPFAYYLTKNNQSIVFEQNQEHLERTCEELSEILKKDLTKEIIMNEIRKQLYEKSQYCDARKNVLLEHVKEGYTNDYWEYQDDVKNSIQKK